MENYIESIGVELEGWWKVDEVSHRELQTLYGFHDDISLSLDGRFPDSYKSYQDGNYYGALGEITNGGYTTSDEDLKLLQNFLNEYWPHKTNSWCGFHVHLKVRKSAYHLLMSSNFLQYFEEEFKKIATYKTLRDRYEGKSKYCMPVNNSMQQVTMRQKSSNGIRYTRLNFCYSMHGTFECRAFTMQTTPNVAYKHVLWFIDLTNKYLNDNDHLIKNSNLISLNKK